MLLIYRNLRLISKILDNERRASKNLQEHYEMIDRASVLKGL